ncbi:hypothetical protein MMC24_002741 [Lignoscripta atroalba]|nr:hypothetical protein [Lignoscripta atroalba]
MRAVRARLSEFRKGRFASPRVEPAEPALQSQDFCKKDDRFKHEPLERARQEIRLFKVTGDLPSTASAADGLLNLKVIHASLQNPPSYLALSYAWGDPAPTHPIICNGLNFNITESLYRALWTVFWHVRTTKTGLYSQNEDILLWADGLCINQPDFEEKDFQVPLMGEIYSKCKGAIAYLGAPLNGADPADAFRAMAWKGGSRMVAPPPGIPSDQNSPEFQAWYQTAQKTPETFKTVELTEQAGRDLGDLFSSPFFRRSWVMQEMILAPTVICLYGIGQHRVSWTLDIMMQLVYRAGTQKHHQPDYHKLKVGDMDLYGAAQVTTWRQLREERQAASTGLNLLSLLERSRATLATDPKDKLYSLLGLVSDEVRQAIRVDYSPSYSVTQTFTDVARYLAGTPYALSLLEHAGISRNISNLPSWVPDWTTLFRQPLASSLYKAAANTGPGVKVLSCGLKLSVSGIRIDRVAKVGIPLNYHGGRAYDGSGESIAGRAEFSVLFQAHMLADWIVRSLGRYPIHEDISDVIWRTATVDRTWAGGRSTAQNCDAYHAFLAALPMGQTISTASATAARDYELACARAKASKPISREMWTPFSLMILESQQGRVLGVMSQGFLGVLPSDARVDDIIVIFFGGRVPFVLRPLDDGEFELVGPCYIHGIMDGEWLEAVRAADENLQGGVLQQFIIR